MDKKSFYGLVEHDENNINLYFTHVKVPKEITDHYKKDKVKRYMIQFDDREAFHGGMQPIGDNKGYFIIVSKALLKSTGLAIGDEVKVAMWPDTSRYGMAISEEMKEVLEQDPEGSELFHNLTDGKIRSLIHKVNTYKSSDIRIARSIIILEHLKANSGKLDWKMLNEAFKLK